MKKRIAMLMVVGMIAAAMLMALIPGVAFGQYVPTPDPGPTSPGTSSPTSGGSSSGGTSTGSASSTGAEVLVYALAGAALLGSGYFVVRKSRA